MAARIFRTRRWFTARWGWYDPPVSVVHRDRPAGVHLAWGLARGDVGQNALEAAITAEAERELAGSDDSTPRTTKAPTGQAKTKSPFLGGTLLKRLQQRGTVQKNIFTWQRGAHGDPYRIAVTAKAIRPLHAKDSQRFALVATLESEDSSVNVYSLVRASPS